LEAKDSAIYGIVGSLAKVDLKQILFVAFVVLGCFLIFLCCCGACIALKRLCLVHCCFFLIITLAFIFFLVIGLALVIVTTKMGDSMTKACNSSDTGDVVEAFRELYTTADSFYCRTGGSGCECYSNGTNPYATGLGYTNVNSSSTVVNSQS